MDAYIADAFSPELGLVIQSQTLIFKGKHAGQPKSTSSLYETPDPVAKACTLACISLVAILSSRFAAESFILAIGINFFSGVDWLVARSDT